LYKEEVIMEDGPIFIGGLAYSGKTPLRLMLSSHPNLVLTRRTRMWTRFYNRYGDLGDSDNFDRCLAAMLQHKPMQALEPDPDRIRREFWQGPPTYGRLFALFHEHHAERLGKARWGDQLGLVERYADPIFSAYPAARMIHMIRDPRHRYEASMTRSRHRRGKVGWVTAGWLHSVSLAQRNKQRYPDRYKIVRYETLVSQPEETLSEILGFIGEELVPAAAMSEEIQRYLEEKGSRATNGPGWGRAVTVSGNGSPRAMSKREVVFTQTYARRELHAFEYPLESIRFSARDLLLFYLVDWPVNCAGVVAWHTMRFKRFAEG
jgi:hypothetical protein